MRTAVLIGVVAALIAPQAASAQRRQRDLITRQEILKSPQAEGDLFLAIKALRPHFLVPPKGRRSLGGAPEGAIAVYIDRIRQPDLESLRTIMAHSVLEVRYLDPARSENEFGITANAGAIVVKRFTTVADSVTKKPPR